MKRLLRSPLARRVDNVYALQEKRVLREGKKQLRDFPLTPDTAVDDFTYVANLKAFFEEVDGQRPRSESNANGDVVPELGSASGGWRRYSWLYRWLGGKKLIRIY